MIARRTCSLLTHSSIREPDSQRHPALEPSRCQARSNHNVIINLQMESYIDHAGRRAYVRQYGDASVWVSDARKVRVPRGCTVVTKDFVLS